jgi:2,4-dienoyl-CoA reductase-like NADH-dependent reductase (Old Yellow Enzyme family)
VPGIFATTRINAYDGLPHPYSFGTDPENPDLEDLTEPLALVKKLKDTGCPLINVSVGIPYVNPHLGRPHDVPLAGQKVPKEHPLVGVARLMRVTGMLQQKTPDLPMVGTGYSWLRHHLPHVGAALVQTKKAAFLGVGRCAFAYPDFVKDLKEKGKMDPEKTCITCSRCSQIMRDGGSAGCVVRDKEVYLPIYREGRK